jgi:hypothetical protein
MRMTQHAVDRMGERMGIKRSASFRIAQRAWERGLKFEETSGQLLVLLNAIFMKYKTANNIRVYAQKVFVFSGETLVTVLPLHQKFRKSAEKIIRRKNEQGV